MEEMKGRNASGGSFGVPTSYKERREGTKSKAVLIKLYWLREVHD